MTPRLMTSIGARGGALVLALALAAATPSAGASGATRAARAERLPWDAPATSSYTAMLEQCMSSAAPEQRSVTFTGQMTAVPGSQRMAMRIVLQERLAGEEGFRDVNAPGLGIWRASEAGVKIYRYVKQITNLSAPATYRALVHFRWLGDNGRVMRRASLRTASCAQPLVSGASEPAPAAG